MNNVSSKCKINFNRFKPNSLKTTIRYLSNKITIVFCRVPANKCFWHTSISFDQVHAHAATLQTLHTDSNSMSKLRDCCEIIHSIGSGNVTGAQVRRRTSRSLPGATTGNGLPAKAPAVDTCTQCKFLRNVVTVAQTVP